MHMHANGNVLLSKDAEHCAANVKSERHTKGERVTRVLNKRAALAHQLTTRPPKGSKAIMRFSSQGTLCEFPRGNRNCSQRHSAPVQVK